MRKPYRRLRLTKKSERYIGAQKLHRMQLRHYCMRLMCPTEGSELLAEVAAMGDNLNHADELRSVVEIDNDGTVWYRKPGEIGTRFDSPHQWVAWKTGVDDGER